MNVAPKGKTFRAPVAAKGLGRGADWLPYPMRRGSMLSTVLTAAPDQWRQVTYSPFS